MHNYIYGGLIGAVLILAFREYQREMKSTPFIRTSDGHSTDVSVHDNPPVKEQVDGRNIRTAYSIDGLFLGADEPLDGRVVTNINEAGGMMPEHFQIS